MGPNEYLGLLGRNTQSIAGTDQAAGTEITETVPANRRWIIVGIRFRLVTDGTTPVRTVHLEITDGTNVMLRFPAGTTQAASATEDYQWVAGFDTASIDISDDHVETLPLGLILPSAWTIGTSTDAVVAGDNFGAPRLWIIDL